MKKESKSLKLTKETVKDLKLKTDVRAGALSVGVPCESYVYTPNTCRVK